LAAQDKTITIILNWAFERRGLAESSVAKTMSIQASTDVDAQQAISVAISWH